MGSMRQDKYQILKEAFGYDRFRDGQEALIDALVSHRDVLAVMPTGAGKSICYQVPALMLPGLTLVISPLISLMKDQVTALEKSGIPAAFLNSSLDAESYVATLRGVRMGEYRLLYVAPERLAVPSFVELCCDAGISLVAVDEAHCISQWGQDFRPEYLRIPDFIAQLPERPVIGAFTATATPRVRTDIRENLRLTDPQEITLTFNRSNLYFAIEKPKDCEARLRRLIRDRPEQSGIVYCSTRKAVEQVCSMLKDFDIPAGRYHAGMSPEERARSQEDFLFDRTPVMVATNAFGMGIDKSNVSYVIHYNIPKTLEAYYQEAGRAGRDGEPADCILLYAGQDVHTQKWLIEHSDPNPALTEEEQEEIRAQDFRRLMKMVGYAKQEGCLRKYILNYFGEKTRDYCGNCSFCLSSVRRQDITIDAQKIMSCVRRTGEKFGTSTLIGVLRGSEEERILALGLNRQSTYGIMRDQTPEQIRRTILELLSQNYLQYAGEEGHSLMLTKSSWPVLRGQESVFRLSEEPAEKPNGKPEADGEPAAASEDEALYRKLRQLRLEISKEEQTPAFVVFNDATLRDMCRRRPRTREEFLQVSGVGEKKAERYGERFLEVFQALPPEPVKIVPFRPKMQKVSPEDLEPYVPGITAVWNGQKVSILSRSGDIAEILLPDGTKRRISLSVALIRRMLALQ